MLGRRTSGDGVCINAVFGAADVVSWRNLSAQARGWKPGMAETRCGSVHDIRPPDRARSEMFSPIKAPTVEMLLLRSLGPGSCSNESIVNINGIHRNLVLRKYFSSTLKSALNLSD
jgi:hypothetical protein